MKRTYIAGLAILSLGLSTQAMAKDIDAADILVGDFMSVGSINVKKIAANKMVDQAIQNNKDALSSINELKAAGIDYKKDIDVITVALDDKGHGCTVIDGSNAIKPAFEAYVAKKQYTSEDYKGVVIYTSGRDTAALLSETRMLACDKYDIKPSIDNFKADKPKTLKDRASTVYNMYNQASKSADIRFGAKMTKSLKEKGKTYKLDGENGASIGVTDIDASSLSISLASGIDMNVLAQTKSADVATSGAKILNDTIGAVAGDPSLEQLGLGFLAKAYKISADKKNIKANVKLSEDQINLLLGLLDGVANAK